MDLREDPSGPPGLFNSDCFYNAMGAATLVTAMALTGYVFANEVATLLDYFEEASWILAGGLFGLAYWIWYRQKKNFKKRKETKKAA